MSAAPPPLSGLRVLDLSRVLAGPTCTMALGDLGADVVKVERPGTGDDTRQWGPPFDADGLSAYFCSCNRNKRSLCLDLKSEQGARTALDLAARADVVVENFLPGTLDRLGLGYDTLRATRGDLILCSITGFGQTGPRRLEPGYDLLIQGLSGLMSITGEADGEPLKVGVAITDVNAGLQAATAVLAALWRRERTGDGEHLDVALLDTAIASLANVAASHLMTGEAPQRYGNAHPSIVPYGVFHCADGPIILAVGNDGQWRRLAQALGTDWDDHDAWAQNPDRVARRDEVCGAIGQTLAGRTRDPVLEALRASGVPAGPVNDLPAVFGDEQVRARGLRRPLPSGDLVGPPVQWRHSEPGPTRRPPRLGEHGDEVLAQWLG